MVCAADVAEKAVGVTVEDIRGSCPQNMILWQFLAIPHPLSQPLKKSNEKTRNENGNGTIDR